MHKSPLDEVELHTIPVCNPRKPKHYSCVLSLTARNKPVRLIFACPVKECRAFCSNEAAFEAHFDAHLESRTSGRIGDYFRRTSHQFDDRGDFGLTDPDGDAVAAELRHRRHVKSASSLVDLADIPDMVFDRLLSQETAVSPVNGASRTNGCNDDAVSSARTSPAKLDSPSTPMTLLDGKFVKVIAGLKDT